MPGGREPDECYEFNDHQISHEYQFHDHRQKLTAGFAVLGLMVAFIGGFPLSSLAT